MLLCYETLKRGNLDRSVAKGLCVILTLKNVLVDFFRLPTWEFSFV